MCKGTGKKWWKGKQKSGCIALEKNNKKNLNLIVQITLLLLHLL